MNRTRPVTAAQAAMFYAEQKITSDSAYNVTTVLAVEGPLDEDALVAGCRRLAAATPALRLRIDLRPDGEVHYWCSSEPVAVDVVDLPGASEDQAREPVDAVAAQRFASDGGALSRFVVVRLAADQARVAIVCHHLAVDGATHALLATRLGEALDGDVEDEPEEAYAALVASVRAREDQWLEEGLRYWAHRLPDDLDAPDWAAVLPAGSAPGDRTGGTWLTSLPASAEKRLVAAAQADDLRLFHLLAAAVHRSLPGDPGCPSVVAAAASIRPTPTAARPLTGCFINQVPVLSQGSRPEESVRGLALRQAGEWREDLRHRFVPFTDLVARTQPHGRPAVLDRVVLTYRTQPRWLSWRGSAASYSADLYPKYLEAKTDFTIRFFHHPGELELDVQWSDALGAAEAECFTRTLLDTLLAV